MIVVVFLYGKVMCRPKTVKEERALIIRFLLYAVLSYGQCLLFFYRYFVDTLLMASALELGGEELVHDTCCHVRIDEAAGHHEHVGVVVLTDEVCNLGNPAEACANGLMLVERHIDAFARAADGDARKDFACLDAAS